MLSPVTSSDNLTIRKAKGSAIAALFLALPSVSAFAGNVVSQPNPVGEKLYREHMWPIMLPPVLIIAGALILARVVQKRAR